MLHRSTNYHLEMPQQRHHVSFRGVGGVGGAAKSQPCRIIWLRCYLVIAAIILMVLHLHLMSILDYDLQGQHKLHLSENNQNFVDVQQNMKEPKVHPNTDFTQATAIKYTATFNNIPVQLNDTPPKVTTVKCISPKPQLEDADNDDKFGWMYRTCKYKNLCYDTSSRQYVAISTGATDGVGNEFPSVSIGGINPRWTNTAKNTTTSLLDIYNSDIRKVQWKPKVRPQQPTNASSSSYYRMDDEYIFIPFHSMAGHNVGHLIWDDLYAIYTALRLRNYIYTDPNEMNLTSVVHPKFLFLRHVLEESTQQQQQQLYANCDIRRNKRIQCKDNFERFLPLFGNLDVRTFTTSKTSQLNVITNEINDNVNIDATKEPPPPSSSLVCFDKTIAGIGLLTDHGWNDHGWETPSSLRPPHNLGRGRLFYDFTQYLVNSHLRQQQQQKLETTTISSLPKQVLSTTTSIDEQWIPHITFSIESSRDWSRRLNFTNQMNALKAISDEKSGSIHRNFVVQSYRMYELSLSEQIDVAMKTNIFVSVCGGGSMTTTFLPRNAVVILFYDPHGGHDYYNNNVHPNALPARLDWDLLNHAAHLRVHWLPISSMDTPDHKELFLRLVRHELTMIHSMRTTL